MRKPLLNFLVFSLFLSLSSCGSKDKPAPVDNPNESDQKETEEAQNDEKAQDAEKVEVEKKDKPGVAKNNLTFEIEDIGENLKVPLIDNELKKYCRFVEYSMIEDLLKQPDKRQYTLEKYMRDDGTKKENKELENERLKLIDAHVGLREVLCNEENHFEGFNLTENSSEDIILKILTVRHLWNYISEQNMPKYIRSVSGNYKTSFSLWEKAFGSPEKVLWNKFFQKNSALTEKEYLARIEKLSKIIKTAVDESYLAILNYKPNN